MNKGEKERKKNDTHKERSLKKRKKIKTLKIVIF